MDWNDLRYFLAVARTGSLSAATRELGTSQATIGRRVQALETALGAVLFERLNTGYVLTSAGREIQARAEAAEAAVLAVARGVDRELGQVQGSVRLATGEALASHLIAPRASLFRATYPALRLEFVTGFRAVSLSRHEADLALRLIRPDQGDYIRRKVGVVGFGLYASSASVDAHPALRCDPWSVDFIGWDASMRDVPMTGWIKGQALDRIVATATSMNVQLALARASLGAAILPCFVADSVPDLVRLAGPSDVGILDLWVVAHRDLSRVPRVRAVLDFVGGLCEQESARLRGV
ncbi:LysR family transcriptional regulator [Sinorhizobium psoraleae]|uniref:LysR family transcriptional regulator n=1 Tax=Sinorhizobium psoraleae TaxID=520838 RepID=A0ABT4KBC4_9HYPH|nr:LysR family transcriptional regulator [Sinorhizobium psoraleae]MCZ4089254.1 LysR family transcriptional regulator [Sinorhizobium psoraleae]